jgi:predicted RNA-binding Zn-ribbon protein involved in translation (DUF1610 family)
MEKKEAKIKCTGCGTHYKLRIPVTDKPVSFKCKKCGKVLKIKLKASEPEPQAAAPTIPAPTVPEGLDFTFETTQLPDTEYYQDTPAPSEPGPEIEGHIFGQAPIDTRQESGAGERTWIILSGESVRGPYSNDEIITMIQDGEIASDTQLRMGERPWIKASDIATFRSHFLKSSLSFGEDEVEEGKAAGGPLSRGIASILPYPVTGPNLIPFAIFAGIAFVLSALLSFDFLIGLIPNLIGWAILYGYLSSLMEASKSSPNAPAPEWDFGNIKNWVTSGGKILLLMVTLSSLPVAFLTLIMIAGFLNGISVVGYLFMLLIPILFAGTLLIVPASLITLDSANALGAAFNPGRWMAVIKSGGQSYHMVALVSVAAGMAVFIIILAAVFITDIPVAGFILAGLLMGFVLAYGHFVLFHVLGRFRGERESRALSGAEA